MRAWPIAEIAAVTNDEQSEVARSEVSAEVSRLAPTRLRCVSPASETTGTPLESASQVVVVPW